MNAVSRAGGLSSRATVTKVDPRALNLSHVVNAEDPFVRLNTERGREIKLADSGDAYSKGGIRRSCRERSDTYVRSISRLTRREVFLCPLPLDLVP